MSLEPAKKLAFLFFKKLVSIYNNEGYIGYGQLNR
jgi:hypothetical protein